MLLWTRVPLPRVAPLGRLPPTNCLCLGPMTAAMTSPSAKQVCGAQPGFPEYGSLEVGVGMWRGQATGVCVPVRVDVSEPWLPSPQPLNPT